MNMKDAFRFQNKLKGLMCEATAIASGSAQHCQSQNHPSAEQGHVRHPGRCGGGGSPSEYAGHANEVAAFLMSLLEEQEKLCKAIHAAKNSLELDMDSEVGLNRQRQDLAEAFRHMAVLRNSEKRPSPVEAPASDSTVKETRSPTAVMPRRSPPSTSIGIRSGAWPRR